MSEVRLHITPPFPPVPDAAPNRRSGALTRLMFGLVTAWALAWIAPRVHAQTAPQLAQAAPAAAGVADNGESQIRRFVERTAVGGNRFEVQVGQLDPRFQLAPCARIEPFVPSGVRLWGRTTIGVRCVSGANWVVSLPITVSVFGNALVATGNLAANTVTSASQFRTEEIDLTREAGSLQTDSSQIDGKVLARPMAAGQVLRTDHLRILQTVAAGDPIKIRIIGDGFTVSADGVALSPGGDGQTLRVRMENGKILAGVVKEKGVEIRL